MVRLLAGSQIISRRNCGVLTFITCFFWLKSIGVCRTGDNALVTLRGSCSPCSAKRPNRFRSREGAFDVVEIDNPGSTVRNFSASVSAEGISCRDASCHRRQRVAILNAVRSGRPATCPYRTQPCDLPYGLMIEAGPVTSRRRNPRDAGLKRPFVRRDANIPAQFADPEGAGAGLRPIASMTRSTGSLYSEPLTSTGCRGRREGSPSSILISVADVTRPFSPERQRG